MQTQTSFTKGAVERLVRFVKDNFLAGRVFGTITDLNYEAWNGAIPRITDTIKQLIVFLTKGTLSVV